VIEIEATNQTIVLVCVTCRIPNDVPDAPPAGLLLAEATSGAAHDDANISVQRVRCLGNCSRGPSAAIQNKHTWTYVFGSLDPLRDGPALVEGARLLASASDGLMPWRGRPESLKRGLIARVPPIGWHDDTDVKPA
jgi:predicted metal-binding protein